MRMNILPMFINIFLPWGAFMYCYGLCSFYLMYSKPLLAWTAVSLVFVLWIVFVLMAYCARKYHPDPTWFTFFSVLVLICAIWGILGGLHNLNTFERPYYTLGEMTSKSGVDPSTMSGEDAMDAGIVNFLPGTMLDAKKTWHFKKETLYCVAPIVGPGGQTPLRQTYDFWAVGKDCCAVGASDFRCGSWGSTTAHTGLRELNEKDLIYYQLAINQAESLYDLMAPHPIFLEWVENTNTGSRVGDSGATDNDANTATGIPKVDSWHSQSFKNYAVQSVTNFIFCMFCVALASARFAYLGRSNRAYDFQVLDEPRRMKPVDMSAQMYTA